MDANWNYVNGETFAGDDDKAIQIESEYNFDLNGDGSIGFDSSKNGKFDDADLSAGSLEQSGDFKSLKDINNNLYAGSVANPVKFNGKIAKTNELEVAGWEIVGVDEDTSYKNTSKKYMVIKETATEQYALVDFGNDWDFTVGVETFDLFTKDKQDEAFEKAEKIMGQDFNNDGILGKKWTELENVGNYQLKYDYINEVKVVDKNNSANEYYIKYLGENFSYQLGDWNLKQADSIADNSKWLVWENGKTKQLSLWQLDDNWNFKKTIFTPRSNRSIQIENTFNVDLNADTFIGLDSSKNGKFDDADLSAGSLEQSGDFKSLKDINNNLYAGSIANPVKFNGKISKIDELEVAGWEIVGVDVDTSYKNTSKKYMVIKETATEQYALVDFGNDWDFTVGVETFDLFTKDVQDEAFEKAEKIMGQDFNNDGILGKKWTEIENVGNYQLSYDYINEVKVVDKNNNANEHYIKFLGRKF